MCSSCASSEQLNGPGMNKQGVLSMSNKEDGTGPQAPIDGDNHSPEVAEQSYTRNESTAAPITKNNGNL